MNDNLLTFVKPDDNDEILPLATQKTLNEASLNLPLPLSIDEVDERNKKLHKLAREDGLSPTQQISDQQKLSLSDNQKSPTHANQKNNQNNADQQDRKNTTSPTTDFISEPSRENNATDQNDDVIGESEKLSQVPDTEKVSRASDGVDDNVPVVEGEVLQPIKRKRGRPKGSTKKIKVAPKLSLSKQMVARSSIFYVSLYANSLSEGEIEKRYRGGKELTLAEKMALELLLCASKGEKKAWDKYWQIALKEGNSTSITINQQKSDSSLLDDMLSEVEDSVFGDMLDNPPTPEV